MVNLVRGLRLSVFLTSVLLLTACSAFSTPSSKSPAAKPPTASASPPPPGLWVSDLHTNTVTDFEAPPAAHPRITITAGVGDPDALAFDANGDLWVAEGASPPRIVEYRGGSVVHNAAPVAQITNFGGVISPEGLAFDSHGNLWIAGGTAVEEYLAAGLPSNPQPARIWSDETHGLPLDGPDALAFDPHGNLWVASYDNRVLLEFAAASLTKSHPAPLHILQLPSGDSPLDIAFDPNGNLWVACTNDSIYEFGAASLGRTTTPHAIVNLSRLISGGVPGIAFDQTGNLFASAVGSGPSGAPEGVVYEFFASTLGTTDVPSATLVASPSQNPGTWALALYPVPKGTGLP